VGNGTGKNRGGAPPPVPGTGTAGSGEKNFEASGERGASPPRSPR